MKTTSWCLAVLCAFSAVAGAFEPKFNYKLSCESRDGTKKAEYFLSEFGHPMHGFWYKGIGIVSDAEITTEPMQFYFDWDTLQGKPLLGNIELQGGLRQWELSMTAEPPGQKTLYRVLERQVNCGIGCQRPIDYQVSCRISKP